MAPPARSPLFGRDPELASLGALFDEPSRRGGALVITGDPGTGKSALLVEAGSRAERTGRLVLRVAGVETEAAMPFAGMQQLLRPVMAAADRLPDRQRQILLDAFGSTRASPEIFLIALATLNLLSDLAARQSVAVIVDDAHWLDVPTLEVLSFVARRLETDPIIVLLASREGFGHSFAVPGAHSISLLGLDDKAAANLLDASFPRLSPHARTQVLELAAGNPLALTELPPILEGTPLDAPAGDLPLTHRLMNAFAARTQGLPPTTRCLLLVLAHDDQPSVSEVLAATSKLVEQPATLDDFTPAEAARLVSLEGQSIRFRHPLIRSAVRQTASSAQRHAIHAGLAELLDNQPERSVWHRAACAIEPDEQLAEQLEGTAWYLRQRRDTATAIAALRRAAQLSASEVRKGARLVAAAELALELGRNEEVRDCLDAAESLILDVKARHSTLWLREALAEASGTGSAASMVAVAEQLATEGEEHLAVRALYTAAVRCYMYRTDARTAATVATVAEHISLESETPRIAAIRGLAAPDTYRSRLLAEIKEHTAGHIVRAAEDQSAGAEALHLYALALTGLGEFRMAAVFQDAAIARLRAQGRLGLLSRALGSSAACSLALGEWRMASQAADECLRLTGYVRGSPASASDGERVLNAGWSLVVLGTVAGNRGQPDVADALVEEAVQVMGPTGSSFCLAGIQAARASTALAAGRPADAYHHAARLFDPSDIAHHGVSRWGSVVRDFADSALTSGNTRTALRLLEPLRRSVGSDETVGTFAYVDAVLAVRDAEACFRRAFECAPASAYFQARLELAFGRWLRRDRRQIEARTYLLSALDAFDAIGAVPWAEQARMELRASGETVRGRLPDRHHELTAQEMQIAQLAAQGLTNREIGERIFLSHRTIGSHLYRLFPKLGITSRSELAGALGHATG